MKSSVRLAIAVAVVCGAIPWQRSLNAQEPQKQPAPEPVPLESAKGVTIDDLFNDKLSKNVFVKVIIRLSTLEAEGFALGVKKMMGPQSHVTPLVDENQLILVDTVASLREVVKTIELIEMDSFRGLSYKCLNVRAALAAYKLKAILDDPNLANQNAVAGKKGAAAGAAALLGLAPGGGPGAMRAVLPHTITFDQRTNMVWVNGPSSKLGQALKALREIDQPQPNRPDETSIFQIHTVQKGNAFEMVKMLTGMQWSSTYRFTAISDNQVMVNAFTAISDNQIMVYAPAAEQAEIAKMINATQRP